MKDKLKKDDQIMKILNVSEVRRYICGTDKGILELLIRKGQNSYHLTLDSVPLDKETNKELMDLLFPVKQLEVPQVNKYTDSGEIDVKKLIPLTPAVAPKKKGGRPKKTK
jgi:hypothetical protein